MAEDEVAREGGVDREQVRAGLEAEHDRLVGLRRAVGGDGLDRIDPADREPSGVDPRPADPDDELEDRERDQSFLEQLDRRLRDVDDALRRLDRGEYGICEVCGERIGSARLEALPATRFCLVHQAMAERRVGGAVAPGGRPGRTPAS